MLVSPRSTPLKLTPSGFEGVPPSGGSNGCEDRQMVGKSRPEVKETGAPPEFARSRSALLAGLAVLAGSLGRRFLWRYPAAMPPPQDPSTSDPAAGLCSCCGHARRIESDRGSHYYLCELSASDPAFPKYPRLPVLHCPGYELASSETC